MGKKLVEYFSASGVTKKVANMVAEAAGCDLYEIEPKVHYTKADLNWMDKKSRSSVEMSDKKIRPELADNDIDISTYDEIIIGFHIWWYVAPTIINSFLEKHDFSGKKIILFATSGGSGFGNTFNPYSQRTDSSVCNLRWKWLWQHGIRVTAICTRSTDSGGKKSQQNDEAGYRQLG